MNLISSPLLTQAARSSTRPFRTALVNMPFGSTRRPSIQLGLLSAIGRKAGFDIDAHYLNLDLAAEIGVDFYEHLCEHRGHMTGDWLFGHAAFPSDDMPPSEAFFDAFPGERDWAAEIGRTPEEIVHLREVTIPAFVERCACAVDWSVYSMIGFTNTFQQNVASLALARQIKSVKDLRIVFGGSNMEGEMGRSMLASFPEIDLVVSGEADRTFPALLLALRSEVDYAGIPGVLTRTGTGGRDVTGRQSSPFYALEENPEPDYADYFERVRDLGLMDSLAPDLSLPIETSRGCWWGAKHHCTFCGLNGASMGYRSKSAARVMDEVDALSRAHSITNFEAVDNILDRKLSKTFFANIEEARLDFRFFFEVKANMNREDIRRLARGGVRGIQPGIESLSTPILKLMRKGCSMLQNVLCLKWSRYYGVGVSWNLIFGFPGESVEDYERQLNVLHALGHLEPPNGFDRIWLERFSPYYSQADAFGLTEVRPTRSYNYVYPSGSDVEGIAYFFDYTMPNALSPEDPRARDVIDRTRELVAQWNAAWTSPTRPALTYRKTLSGILIDRVSRNGKHTTVALDGTNSEILEFCCSAIRSRHAVVEHLRAHLDPGIGSDEVSEVLEAFCDAGLMVGENDCYLSLPLPANANW
jgi:ribosomal peptide maturation radical SAM protein 1